MQNHEWWKIIDDHLNDLIILIEKFHPESEKFNPFDYPITAKMAEKACESIRQDIKNKSIVSKPIISQFLLAKEEMNIYNLGRILNETWFGMPESYSVRRERGFGILCDLLDDPPEVL